MLSQVVLSSPKHVVSKISPFLLGYGSAMCYPVTTEAEVVPVFLDFFPIWPKFAASEEFRTEVKMDVMQRIGGANQI